MHKGLYRDIPGKVRRPFSFGPNGSDSVSNMTTLFRRELRLIGCENDSGYGDSRRIFHTIVHAMNYMNDEQILSSIIEGVGHSRMSRR